MPRIVDIADIGVGVADRRRFESFAEDILGFVPFRSLDDAQTYFRWDDRHHRLSVADAPANELRYVAFDVGGADDLKDWTDALAEKGIAVRPGSAKACGERRVSAFAEFDDPDGHRIVLGHGFAPAETPARFNRELSVLRTGHVLLTVADTARTCDFYTGTLGFRLSDWVYIDEPIKICFLRVNARHHAFAAAPHAPGAKPRLQHIMVEVESLDDVMRTYHHVRAKGGPIGMGPGKHANCQTVHVYVPTPGGFAVEFGYGHRRVDDQRHQPTVYDIGTPVDVWGGGVQSEEFQLG